MYRRLRLHLVGLLCLALPLAVQAEYQERLPLAVARALKAAAIPQAAVAVVVQEVGAPLPRVSVNAAQSMNPASVMKLLTTYAALELLGPAYTWRTEALASAPIQDGVLAGDLHLRGSGDPKLTFEQFWLLLRQLRARGVAEIRGDLVLDREAFKVSGDETPFDAQPLRPYNVGPDALLLNFKAVRVLLVPDGERGTVAALAEPQPDNLEIVNTIKPGRGACGDWKEGLRTELTRLGAGAEPRWRLVLAGSYAPSCGERTWNLGVLPHGHYVAGVFRQLWQELGGRIAGGLRDGRVPADARLLAAIDSPPLADLVRDINKYSNNVMARQLYLALGRAGEERPARGEDADTAVRAWLAAKGLQFPELVIENGSGLSRRERLSADSIARLLGAAWKSPVMPELMASLPLTAVDGTMKKRLKENGAAGHAHIKTGTLEGVKTIAGYVLDKTGRRQIVVFLVNHPNAQAAQAAQDALLAWVYERGA